MEESFSVLTATTVAINGGANPFASVHGSKNKGNKIYNSSRIGCLNPFQSVLIDQMTLFKIIATNKHKKEWLILLGAFEVKAFQLLFEIYKMNLITNYYELTLEDWEKLANSACYAVNQELKAKGQRYFYSLAVTPDANIINSLIMAGSETLLFVLFSYLSKYPTNFGKKLENVKGMIQCITSWQFVNFTFIRNNQSPLPSYVTRTIMTSLGSFLKIRYENQHTGRQLMEYLTNLQSNFFKLYLFKSFVDAVEVVDYEMGYIKYRLMVQSFQDNVIPVICETLMPYFYNIEEGALINELSFMQEHLNVNDSNDFDEKSTQIPTSITSEQEQQTDYVFMLLQKIVQFNYNITYSQYQSDIPIDSCLITFPDKVSQKILNHQFLNALFFIIQKVSNVKVGEKRHKYLEISLACVAKLMQSRMTYLDIVVKEGYIFHALKGLTHLLIKCKTIGSKQLLQGIFVCNKKLYMNCQLNFLKQISYQMTQSYDLFNAYIKDLTQMIVQVINRSYIQVDNHLLQQAVELATKILSSYGLRDEQNLDDQGIYFKDFAKSVIHCYISNLAQPLSIFQQTKIISILESKPMISQLFQFFKKIGSCYYNSLFQKILEAIDYFLRSKEKSILILANLLFLIAQLVDHNYLQRNLFLNKAKDRDYCLLGNIITRMMEIVKQYLFTRSERSGQSAFYTDTAIMIFIEALTLEFLSSFQCGVRFKIKQRLYLFMKFGEFYNQFSQIEDQKSQETITQHFRIFTQYLSFAGGSRQHEVIVQYALSAVEKCIFKLKWHMKRQLYLKTEIVSYLSNFFQKFFYNRNCLCDVRSRVAKILVTLTFDDVLDQYKFRINKFLNILKVQPVELMHYDLIGVFQGIQTHSISKYFYNRLKKEIDLGIVVSTIFQNAKNQNDQKSYGDLCKLIRVILNNKGFKISNSVIAYEVFKLLLPYYIAILKDINRTNFINMDLWESSICEIIEVFKSIVGGTHINIFLLDSFTLQYGKNLSLIKEFIIELMRTVILLSCSIHTFPEMQQMMLSFCSEINKALLDYIFCDSTGRLIEVYGFLHIKMIDLTIGFIKMVINGNKVLEDKLIKSFQCLRSFFTFLNKKSKIIHNTQLINNLKKIYQMSEHASNNLEIIQNKNTQLIDFSINFVLTTHKNNPTFIKTILRLIYELNILYQTPILGIISKLDLPQEKVQEMEEILTSEERNDEENFIERMKNWIKQVDLFA